MRASEIFIEHIPIICIVVNLYEPMMMKATATLLGKMENPVFKHTKIRDAAFYKLIK